MFAPMGVRKTKNAMPTCKAKAASTMRKLIAPRLREKTIAMVKMAATPTSPRPRASGVERLLRRRVDRQIDRRFRRLYRIGLALRLVFLVEPPAAVGTEEVGLFGIGSWMLDQADDPVIQRRGVDRLGQHLVDAGIARLDDPEETVRAAAGDALRQITQVELPTDRAAWEAALLR